MSFTQRAVNRRFQIAGLYLGVEEMIHLCTENDMHFYSEESTAKICLY